MSQVTIGTPVDNPAGYDVLVTSQGVGPPRQYTVRLTIASEPNFWATVEHRAANYNPRNTMLIPVTGPLFGPKDIYKHYFHRGDYVRVFVRGGEALPEEQNLVGTNQATVELI